MNEHNTSMVLKNKRIQSIDLLRGIVMVIMALDHTRDFLHYGASIDQLPLDLATTTPVLFFTRWITHFCAPIFVFLSGTSVFLYSTGKTKSQVAIFLFTRGIWLMLAELFIIFPIWNFTFSMIYLQVIWAIGLSMVVLSVLQYLPYKLLLILGLVIIFGHNFLDSVKVETPFISSLVWSVIHERHDYFWNKNFMIVVQYPFLPWLGVMILGYTLGKLYVPGIQQSYRKKILLRTGLASIVLFICLRALNIYGDMQPWAHQSTRLFTFMDFLKTTKYPPSLLFILMTLGPGLLFLSLAESLKGKLKELLVIFGKVPFFYYVLHILFIHILSFAIFLLSGHRWEELDFTHFREGSMPFGSGYSLWVVYVVWISIVMLLYFPCRWYSRYKASHHFWWLSYI